MTYSLQHEVFLASCYWAINFVIVWSNGKIRDKTMAQQVKSWHLNATGVLVLQQQIFINKIHVWQVESYS